MISEVVQKKISEGAIILYRRTSTEKQAKDGRKDQLKAVRKKYPKFTISKSTIYDIAETISGRADAELRMCSGLGKCLKQLKRHPHSIMLVSHFDRVARRADIFELIMKQGLGDRIYEVATGRPLTEVVMSGGHITIEEQTKANAAARDAGIKKFKASGGVMGSVEIGKQSLSASRKKSELAKEREAAVLTVVRQALIGSRGIVPTDKDLCDRLDDLGLRTGQGRLWTPPRIQQRRKTNREAWAYAKDSYHRPRRRLRQIIDQALTDGRSVRDAQLSKARRRGSSHGRLRGHDVSLRIRFLVTAAQIEVRKHRECQKQMMTLLLVTNGVPYDPRVNQSVVPAQSDDLWSLAAQHNKQLGCDGCRGPPEHTPTATWAAHPLSCQHPSDRVS